MRMVVQNAALCFKCGWTTEPWFQSANLDNDLAIRRRESQQQDAHRSLWHGNSLMTWWAIRRWGPSRLAYMRTDAK